MDICSALFSRDLCAIILSGGVGSRMNSPIPKQYLPLYEDRSVIEFSMLPFFLRRDTSYISIVMDSRYRHFVDKAFEKILPQLNNDGKVPTILFSPPGKERVLSTVNGLRALLGKDCGTIVIHDAARPLLTPADLDTCIDVSKKVSGCILGKPITGTLKKVSSASSELSFAFETVSREGLFEIQTPQAYSADLLFNAIEKFSSTSLSDADVKMITDDEILVRKFANFEGTVVIEAKNSNLKITSLEDLQIARSIMLNRFEGAEESD